MHNKIHLKRFLFLDFFYAYFPYQRFLLFGFFFFPFPLISKTSLLNCASPWHRSKRKRIYQKTIRFVKYLLFFFIFIFLSFFHTSKPEK